MHVIEFLANFLFTPDIEIVEPRLPEARQIRVTTSSKIPRNALLQYFQGNGRRVLGGFADEQMYMIGHNHIAYERKFIAFTDFSEGLNEDIACSRRAEQR